MKHIMSSMTRMWYNLLVVPRWGGWSAWAWLLLSSSSGAWSGWWRLRSQQHVYTLHVTCLTTTSNMSIFYNIVIPRWRTSRRQWYLLPAMWLSRDCNSSDLRTKTLNQMYNCRICSYYKHSCNPEALWIFMIRHHLTIYFFALCQSTTLVMH